MATIQETHAKFKKLTPKVFEQGILEIIRRHEAALVDYNITQMMEGKKADGKDITPEYADSTKHYKMLRNQPSDKVTLRDEGDFQTAMFATANKFPVMLDSQDYKTDKLVKKYGEIFGLTEENKTKFAKELEEDIKGFVKSFF